VVQNSELRQGTAAADCIHILEWRIWVTCRPTSPPFRRYPNGGVSGAKQCAEEPNAGVILSNPSPPCFFSAIVGSQRIMHTPCLGDALSAPWRKPVNVPFPAANLFLKSQPRVNHTSRPMLPTAHMHTRNDTVWCYRYSRHGVCHQAADLNGSEEADNHKLFPVG
jgi:hypothetical protein